jgi:allantoate deiminase
MSTDVASPTEHSGAADASGARAEALLRALARRSEPGEGVTRLPFTPEHGAALDLLRTFMSEAGLAVSLDAAGTLIGRLAGPPGAPTLLLGSHQDSVRHGGAYDGIMGVVLPVLALGRLREAGVALPYAVEVLGFADEEGMRFPTALLGPRALAGTLDPAVLAMRDREGIALAEAMRRFGLDPDALGSLQRDPADVLGFVEVHIEQGPVLEHAGEALGVVTAIAGIERHSVRLTGRASHAGTVPMALRCDAMAGAAELVTAVERHARETPGLLANVGALEVWPNAANAIPGRVDLVVELRSDTDAVRERAGVAIATMAAAIAGRRGLGLAQSRSYFQSATPCDPALTTLMHEAIRAVGGAGQRLPSGAIHDASAMADLCPIGMLFVRCREGISHNPAEHASAADMGLAVAALSLFLRRLAARRR